MQPPKPKNTSITQVDHETGMIHLPGVEEPTPLVGPTSGSEYKKLIEKENEKRDLNQRLIETMKKRWQCLQCRKIWGPIRFRPDGRAIQAPFIRAVWRKPEGGGNPQEVLVCGDLKCDGPVIEYKSPADGFLM